MNRGAWQAVYSTGSPKSLTVTKQQVKEVNLRGRHTCRGLLTVWGSRRGKNYADSKKSVVAKDNQGSENKYIEHKGPLGRYTILFDTIVVYPGHYTFVETYRTYNTKNEP